MAKKSLTLIMGLGPKKPMGDEGEDLHAQEKEAAGKAFASAVKSGDGADIAEAFEALFLACKPGKADEGEYASMGGADHEDEESETEE